MSYPVDRQDGFMHDLENGPVGIQVPLVPLRGIITLRLRVSLCFHGLPQTTEHERNGFQDGEDQFGSRSCRDLAKIAPGVGVSPPNRAGFLVWHPILRSGYSQGKSAFLCPQCGFALAGASCGKLKIA
jgi:hypothetical protein